MKILLQLFLFLFPWKIRRFVLVKFLKYQISPKAKIGYSIILAKKMIMKDSSRIGNLTFCTRIDLLQLNDFARLGSLNYITGYSGHLNQFFLHVVSRQCELIIDSHSAITGRHFIDSTAGVYIGKFVTFAGIRSQILTHSIDLRDCKQDASSVSIGDYCFVGTGCIILKGSNLPAYSVLGAGSLLNKFYKEIACLYGGVPAKKISTINRDEYKYFSRETGFVY
jgi:acetyltransferase-like isoleucine patch superfamily enzyme